MTAKKTKAPTFISLLAAGHDFKAGRRGEMIWLHLSSSIGGSLERITADSTTDEFYAALELLAKRFVPEEKKNRADPKRRTDEQLVKNWRTKQW